MLLLLLEELMLLLLLLLLSGSGQLEISSTAVATSVRRRMLLHRLLLGRGRHEAGGRRCSRGGRHLLGHRQRMLDERATAAIRSWPPTAAC